MRLMKKTKAAFLVTLAISGCGVHRTTTELETPRYPTGEAAAVYRATLDALYGFEEQPTLVSDTASYWSAMMIGKPLPRWVSKFNRVSAIACVRIKCLSGWASNANT